MAAWTPVSDTGRRAPPAAARPAVRRIRAALRTPAGAMGATLTLLAAGAAAAVPILGTADPLASVGPPLQPPSGPFPMGTDDLGRDVMSGVLHGLRTSLLVTLAVTALAVLVGVSVGAIAGYVGRAVDDTLMRITELVQVVPRFFLAVLVAALFGPGVDRLALVLGLTSWPWLARVTRAETLALREQGYVEAARALGASWARILLREVLPGILPSVVVMASLIASGAILLEAGIGFIGLADPDLVSLGTLAKNAQGFLRVAWWMAVFPGAAIAVATVGINLLGDAINDALDPRRRPWLPPASERIAGEGSPAAEA